MFRSIRSMIMCLAAMGLLSADALGQAAGGDRGGGGGATGGIDISLGQAGDGLTIHVEANDQGALVITVSGTVTDSGTRYGIPTTTLKAKFGTGGLSCSGRMQGTEQPDPEKKPVKKPGGPAKKKEFELQDVQLDPAKFGDGNKNDDPCGRINSSSGSRIVTT